MSDNKSLVDHYDSIVIGSGISGLTIALILAKHGKKVAVFERDTDIAPLIRPYKRKGVTCNPGLHYSGWMNPGGVVETFLNYLNVKKEVNFQVLHNGFFSVEFKDKVYDIPKGYDTVQKALIAYFPDDENAIVNYMRMVKEINESSYFFNHTLTPGSLNEHGIAYYFDKSVHDCLKKYQASPDLVELISLFSYMLIGSAGHEMPFIMHAFVMGGIYHEPGYFIEGSLKAMLNNFKIEMQKYGVDLFLRNEVQEILVDENRMITGIKDKDGKEYKSDKVVATFHPKLLKDIVRDKAFRPAFIRRLEETENSYGMYVAIYDIDHEKASEMKNMCRIIDEEGVYVAATLNHSDKGSSAIVFMGDTIQNLPANQEEKEKRAQSALNIINETLKEIYPEFADSLVLVDFLKPWSFERYTKTVNGSAYGLKQSVNYFGYQHKAPIRGLYLTGQAIYPGFLGSMISSFGLAFIMLGSDEFWKEVVNQ